MRSHPRSLLPLLFWPFSPPSLLVPFSLPQETESGVTVTTNSQRLTSWISIIQGEGRCYLTLKGPLDTENKSIASRVTEVSNTESVVLPLTPLSEALCSGSEIQISTLDFYVHQAQGLAGADPE